VAQKGKADEKAAVDIGRESLRPSRTLRGAGLCRSVALSCGRWRTSELLRRLPRFSPLTGPPYGTLDRLPQGATLSPSIPF